MALQKKSILNKVLLQFDEDGKYVVGEALFKEGAWDTDLVDWYGEPVAREYALTNMTAEGKKFLNDVIGVAAAKALEAATVAAEKLEQVTAANERNSKDLQAAYDSLKEAQARAEVWMAEADKLKQQFGVAWKERDRVAQEVRDETYKLSKIPSWLRRLFGAV